MLTVDERVLERIGREGLQVASSEVIDVGSEEAVSGEVSEDCRTSSVGTAEPTSLDLTR